MTGKDCGIARTPQVERLGNLPVTLLLVCWEDYSEEDWLQSLRMLARPRPSAQKDIAASALSERSARAQTINPGGAIGRSRM